MQQHEHLISSLKTVNQLLEPHDEEQDRTATRLLEIEQAFKNSATVHDFVQNTSDFYPYDTATAQEDFYILLNHNGHFPDNAEWELHREDQDK